MTNQGKDEDDHSERAIEAMGVYLSQGMYDMSSQKLAAPDCFLLLAAYMQGAAAIQAAELTVQALDRLTAAIALSGTVVRGTA